MVAVTFSSHATSGRRGSVQAAVLVNACPLLPLPLAMQSSRSPAAALSRVESVLRASPAVASLARGTGAS
eukprot:10893469-Alexandrium_andersonii.AAC.1